MQIPAPTLRYLPASPVEINFFGPNETPSMHKVDGQITFRFEPNQTTSFTGLWPTQIEAETVRTPFLAVETPTEALDFLTQTGTFLQSYDDQSDTDMRRESLTWSEFQAWQSLISEVVVNGFLTMFRRAEGGRLLTDPDRHLPPELSELLQRLPQSTHAWIQGQTANFSYGEYPLRSIAARLGKHPEGKASILVVSAVDAMLADYFLDTLDGVNYRRCALDKCRKLFVASPNRGKLFCSQAHAHLNSMRESRKRSKLADQQTIKRNGGNKGGK